MTQLEQGYIHVYTGNGKGKSTAALGLALRAAGAGLKTVIIQFMKEYPYSEKVSLESLAEFITIEAYGKDDFVLRKEPAQQSERDSFYRGILRAREVMNAGGTDVLILDEICVSNYFGLISTEEILEVMSEKPARMELVLTGRYCPEEVLAAADLVTEMREVKHYYSRGVLSRKGIDS